MLEDPGHPLLVLLLLLLVVQLRESVSTIRNNQWTPRVLVVRQRSMKQKSSECEQCNTNGLIWIT